MTDEPHPPAENYASGGSSRRPVAVLIFDDIEVLDFAGPFEAFGVARTSDVAMAFEVVTIALERRPVLVRNGLQVIPHLAVEDITHLDVLVVPGGQGTRREM